MYPNIISIDGFQIKQISGNEYEGESASKDFDFVIEANEVGNFDLFVFDSKKIGDEAFLYSSSFGVLEDCVREVSLFVVSN